MSIGNLDIFIFDLNEWYCQFQWNDSDIEIYLSVWCQIHYDITDKTIMSVLNVIIYIIICVTARPIWLYLTRCDTSDNVCLDLQNWHYSVRIVYCSVRMDFVILTWMNIWWCFKVCLCVLFMLYYLCIYISILVS